MRSAAGRIILKIVILLGCIACVITKALTDQLSRRVFLRNQKLSREWGLLHNLYWSASGNAFANVTYGGFTLITVLMLISRFIDAKSRPSLVEKIFLTVGMLCFFAMGGVVFSAFDQVPSDLHINAIVLGCLSFFVAFLMLIDLADPMARHISDTTQTDFPILPGPPDHSVKVINQVALPAMTKPHTANIEIHPNQINGSHDLHPNHIINGTHDLSPNHINGSHELNPTNGKYTRGEEVDFVQAQMLPSVQQPIFEKLLLPEKQRPHRQHIPDPRSNRAHLEYRAPPSVNYEPNWQRPTEHPPAPHRSQYDARAANPQSYSRQSTFNLSRGPPQQRQPQPPHKNPPMDTAAHRHHYNIRNSPTNRHQAASCRREASNCSNSSNEEDNNRAIRPGFVANAARFWDQRAKQNDELNTIV